MIRFLFLLILPFILNAQVEIKVPKSFILGEPVVFSISSSGSDVEFPNIKNINNFVVQNIGTSSQINIINGSRSKKIVRKYRFFPTNDMVIPSFKIKINGKIEQTKPQKIKLQKVIKTKSNNFDLTLKINKDKTYVGEELILTMTFKYKKDIQIYDLKFTPPQFENFWSKQLQTNKRLKDDLYVVQELNFLIFPQKSGVLEISPFRIDVVLPDHSGRSSFFGTPTKRKNIYSNGLKIDVKPLPDNTYLIGDFKIKTTVDKTTIKSGQAVSLQLEIQGRGNIDDLEEYKLDIKNTTVYDNPSQKDYDIKNNKYGGTYKKSYSIVSQEDFTIPPITLKYFDKLSQKIKIIKSKEYKIKVEGAIKTPQKLEVKQKQLKSEVVEKTIIKTVKASNKDKILFFIFGFMIAVLIFVLYLIFKNKQIRQEETPLQKRISKITTQKELLKKLVPYVNIDENLDKMIYKIELNNNLNLKLIKKQLTKIIKELKL